MAGSFRHVTDDKGELLDNPVELLDNLGDAWETIEEMYDIIEYLSDGDEEEIFEAYCYHIEKRNGNIDYVREKGIEHYFPELNQPEGSGDE